MLDIDRGDHIDACTQKVLDVFISLAIRAVGRIRMGQLINEGHGGLSGNDGLHIHLAQGNSVVDGGARRNNLEIADLGGRLRALVGLDIADDDIHAPFFQAVSLLQHRIGFSHAGAGAEVYLELPKLLTADDGQEIIRARAGDGSLLFIVQPERGAPPLRVLSFLFFT